LIGKDWLEIEKKIDWRLKKRLVGDWLKKIGWRLKKRLVGD